jgi:hypothetical protein
VTASSSPGPKPTPRPAMPPSSSAEPPPPEPDELAPAEPPRAEAVKETSLVKKPAKDQPADETPPEMPAEEQPPPAKAPEVTPPRATTTPPARLPDTPRTPALSPSTSADNAPARRGAKHAAEPSLGQLVSDASTHLSTLIHSEIELAKLELRSTVKNAGTGIGLFAAAAVVLVFSLTFGFFALAEGIAAAGLDRWLAFLIVFGLQLAVVVLFAFVGFKKVKRIKAPERTIKTTKDTVDYLKKSRG